jgi:hypothetical protein
MKTSTISLFDKHIDKAYNGAIDISTQVLNSIYDTKILCFNKVIYYKIFELYLSSCSKMILHLLRNHLRT